MTVTEKIYQGANLVPQLCHRLQKSIQRIKITHQSSVNSYLFVTFLGNTFKKSNEHEKLVASVQLLPSNHYLAPLRFAKCRHPLR